MTADEIHDQNMKEFAEALGECAEALEKPQLGPYQDAVWVYENELLPLRKLAEDSEDIGETFDAYKEYDERFGVLLEDMFQQVKTEAALLDTAPELLRVLEELTEWACTHTSPLDENSPHDLLIKARTAIAEAKGVPAG